MTITVAIAVVRRHLNYILLASKLIKFHNEFLQITFLNYGRNGQLSMQSVTLFQVWPITTHFPGLNEKPPTEWLDWLTPYQLVLSYFGAQQIRHVARSEPPQQMWYLSLNIGPLTVILLMWRIGWAPNKANEWQMGFNSAFKGLKNKPFYFASRGPASWSSGQGLWLLIMRSRVRFPVLPWEFFLSGKDSRGDHGLGS